MCKYTSCSSASATTTFGGRDETNAFIIYMYKYICKYM